MEPLPYHGSTSDFYRLGTGRILKAPMKVWNGNPKRQQLEDEMKRAISFEKRVLEKLGVHSRIVPYLGCHGDGSILHEASHGNLQVYLDTNLATINDSLRGQWSLQTIQAVAYIHSKGVIHSDLRPENFLVHATTDQSLDLWLCDFGGARCDDLGINESHIPDDPFFDPRLPWESTIAVDIFSLGSIIYIIMTGHWPYREGPPPTAREDLDSYENDVNRLFAAGIFPDVSLLRGGNVIKGCWDHQYQTAEEVLSAIQETSVVD